MNRHERRAFEAQIRESSREYDDVLRNHKGRPKMSEKHPDDIMKEILRDFPGAVAVKLGEPGTNSDPVGGSELFKLLFKPDPWSKGLADGVLKGLSPPAPIRAPEAIAALTYALAEAIVANTSPPQAWAKVIGDRLREIVAQ
jgi:hypothetical protein